MKAKPLTETSFILEYDMGEPYGIVFELNGKFEVLTKDERFTVDNFKNLEVIVKEDIKLIEREVFKKEENKTIEGLPVKHSDVFEIETIDNIITYKQLETSHVRFAAGYWILNFGNGWLHFFSPKFSTLRRGQSEGPFKNKLEANVLFKLKTREFLKENKE